MGQPFGRYELLKRIAAGGMGEVYLARNAGPEGFEKLLVVKVLLHTMVEDTEFIHMFLDEARIAARLDHPNIVQIYDMGEVDGYYFIAMEYIRGDDVVRLWKQARRMQIPVPMALAVRIAAEAAAGLDYAHKAVGSDNQPLHLVHRDVSPQNILVTFDGCVKLIDFGVAKARGRLSNTSVGTVKGKYAYMSPEQITGQEIDNRSDIFALGVVLYEMLSGIRLFKRQNEFLTIQAVSNCEIPPLSKLNRRIDSDLEAVVMTALAKNRDDRYSDAQSFRLALEEWLISKRQQGTSAHLAAFMKVLYADRLAEERKLGRPYDDKLTVSLHAPMAPKEGDSGASNSFPQKTPSGSPIGNTPRQSLPLSDGQFLGSIPKSLASMSSKSLGQLSDPSEQFSNLTDGNSKKIKVILVALTMLFLGISGTLFITGGSPPDTTPQERTYSEVGRLNLLTTPAGADVYLNGVKLNQITPLHDVVLPKLADPARDRVNIEIRKEGYLPSIHSIAAIGTQNLDIYLYKNPESAKAHQKVKVIVASMPSGAKIIASDGSILGTTPLITEQNYSETPLSIRLELEGYQPLHATLSLQENSRTDLALTPIFQVVAPTPKLSSPKLSSPTVGAKHSPSTQIKPPTKPTSKSRRTTESIDDLDDIAISR